MRRLIHHFKGSFVFTSVALALAAALGWWDERTAAGVAGTVFVVLVLGVLETSLSFDNAVVNATVLRDMTPVWRGRFLTWGIAVAVFGMRLVFPLLVVSVAAHVGPQEALRLAVVAPGEYARILRGAHAELGAFGGAFLAMVCLRYFFDAEKEVHWIGAVERQLARLGKFDAAELGLVMIAVWGVSRAVPAPSAYPVLAAGVFGLVTFIAVEAVGRAMQLGPDRARDVQRASAAGFLYLEVLDASFSFDGVIGAFALTSNLFVIAIGLGIGAMFVRSLTVMLVDRGTLESYRFLEHGAFWAIGALAVIMLVGTVVPVPQALTGLVGAGFIALSFRSSVRYNRARARVAREGRADARA